MRREYNKGDLRIVRNGVVQDVLLTELNQPHSVTVHNGDIFLCESLSSKVIKYPSMEEWKLRGYTRGLVVTDDLIICGISRINFRSSNKFKRAHLGYIDRRTNAISYTPRPKLSKQSEIYEVEILKQ
jgi:hypothetical protein